MHDLTHYWPLFGLSIRTPRLELRLPRDDDMPAALAVVDEGIHDPASTPFHVPWTDNQPPQRDREALQHWWKARTTFSPGGWNLPFFVFHEGAFVGSQAIIAQDFPTMRVAATGSWLGLAHQSQGIGKEMRRAVLELAFAHLGAAEVTSGAFADNLSSQRVSLAVGYEENGRALLRRRDEASEQVNFRITRDRWIETRTDMAIEVTGFDQCVEMFGLGS